MERAIDEAGRRSAQLVVVNASRGDAFTDVGFASVQELELVKSRLKGSGVPFELRQEVRGREPGDEVVTAAEETGADLVVIGMRRRSAVGKFVLGSTARYILFEAPCPVLAVKASDGKA